MRIGVSADHHLTRLPSVSRVRIPIVCIVVAGTLIVLSTTSSTRAQDRFYEVETKYIFGFTEGSGVGLEGEKEFSAGEHCQDRQGAMGVIGRARQSSNTNSRRTSMFNLSSGRWFPRMSSKTLPIWTIAITWR